MKISVVIPVYNVENEINRCIDSILNQTYTNYEIILVDDGATDKSGIICDQYAKKSEKIKVIHKTNGGLSSARNAGLKIASGKYVMFIDSDDYISSNALEKFISIADNKTDIFLGEACEINNDKKTYYLHSHLKEDFLYNVDDVIKTEIKKSELYAPVCFNMYNKDFLLKNNLFFKEGIYHEDMEYLLRLLLKTKNIKYVSNVFYYYIIRDNSITQDSKKNEKKKRDILNIYSDWYKMIDEFSNEKTKKFLYGFLGKCFKTTCRMYKIYDPIYSYGLNNLFLIKYSLDFKEFLKNLFFIINRKKYINVK